MPRSGDAFVNEERMPRSGDALVNEERMPRSGRDPARAHQLATGPPPVDRQRAVGAVDDAGASLILVPGASHDDLLREWGV